MPYLPAGCLKNLAPKPDPERFDTTFVPPKSPVQKPRLYIVGEAPGEAEVVHRKPFVGQAGQTLDKLISAAGIDLSEVRFFNAVPFRPVTKGDGGTARNRTPTRQEISRYSSVLFEDIRKSAPRVILASGKSAMAAFGIHSTIKDARNRCFEFEGMPVLVTYHPQYVAYSGGEGGRGWKQMVRDLKRSWAHGG